ncbi:MAG: magnesium and cobalt transport protein CorA [Ilumatobacteraceae bacterium]
MIIDCAAYVDGKRLDVDTSCIPTPGMLPPSMAEAEFDDTDAAPRWDASDGFVWLGLRMPDVAELGEWCDALHIDEVDPAAVLAPHARPVLTVNGTTVQLVLRTIRYDDREEIASLGEMTLLVRPHSIVTIRHGPTSPLGELRQALERDPRRLREGATAVMVAVIGRVIDDYGPALDGFEADAIEVEGEVFSDSSRQPVRRLYQLKRELRRMFVALDALQDPLDRLMRVFEDHLSREVLADMRENADQLARAAARARSLSDLLDSALTASLTQISVQQNDDMRKISAWVAMAAVPTLVAGIYGMNFDSMPELRSPAGYPLVLLGMAIIVALLYRRFKRSGWL